MVHCCIDYNTLSQHDNRIFNMTTKSSSVTIPTLTPSLSSYFFSSSWLPQALLPSSSTLSLSSSGCYCGGNQLLTTQNHCRHNNKSFQLLVNKAFDACDGSNDGKIDEAELNAGLLLVHLKLAKYAGPAACYPPTRKVYDVLFHKADIDNSSGIDKQEFYYIVGI